MRIVFPILKAGAPLYTLAEADIYIGHIILGTIISIVLYTINRKGVASSATLQKVLCMALVGAGILAGFETIPQGIESAGGDTKGVGKTVVITVVLSCFFYALLFFTLGGALPWKEFIKFSNPSAALMFRSLYPG